MQIYPTKGTHLIYRSARTPYQRCTTVQKSSPVLCWRGAAVKTQASTSRSIEVRLQTEFLAYLYYIPLFILTPCNGERQLIATLVPLVEVSVNQWVIFNKNSAIDVLFSFLVLQLSLLL